ncbi:hypothetical protein J2S13_002056 [Oikeobacillus pervagus]|uniref:Uncharacterized protein n=1 Tax=Oikeobacillus pervagus TaxID=1325931 RepID=A0AAJ1WJM1_9BACI|nr:hypothetical protein [Oikeobacillus pervagus]
MGMGKGEDKQQKSQTIFSLSIERQQVQVTGRLFDKIV